MPRGGGAPPGGEAPPPPPGPPAAPRGAGGGPPTATAFRVGNVALRKGSAPLQTHEQALAGAISGAVLLSSLLALRFPRILAWPLGLIGSVFGGLGIIRALRARLTRERRS